MSVREYIEARCMPVPFSGCWLWLKSVGTHGYGNATRGDTAHRVSFRAFKGSIPPGMIVQHSCDERLCVNPDHLSLGTHQTNCDDKMRKGRGGYMPGRPRQRYTKLTPGEIVSIRCIQEPHTTTARRTGAHWKHISRIRLGQIHSDVDARPDPLRMLPEEIADLEEIEAALDAMADDMFSEVETCGGISSKPTTRVEVYAAALEAGDAA